MTTIDPQSAEAVFDSGAGDSQHSQRASVPLAALWKASFLDPGSGKTASELKIQAARSAIVTVGQDPFERVFVLGAWADKVATGEIMDRIFSANRDWRPKVFGIESNAQQTLFFSEVVREARRRRAKIPLVGGQQSTRVDKMFRIRAALDPIIDSGRLFLPEKGMIELRAELSAYPQTVTVDLVDALASAVALLPRRAAPSQRSDADEAELAYLRAAGMPMAEIALRAGKPVAPWGSPVHNLRDVFTKGIRPRTPEEHWYGKGR